MFKIKYPITRILISIPTLKGANTFRKFLKFPKCACDFEIERVTSSHPLNILVLTFFIAVTACGKEKTTVNWQKQTSNVTFDLRAVHFYDAQNGIICGGQTWGSGFILRTRDGGTTWKPDSLLPRGFYGLGTDDTSRNHREGGTKTWIVGNSGHVFEFSKHDTALRWVGQPYDAWFRDVAVRGQTGFTVGGQAWQAGKIVRFDVETGKKQQLDTFPQEVASVCFSDDSTVHAVGYGLVLRSTDKGKTWQPQVDLKGDFFQSVCFPSEHIGYIVGQNGGILKTTDGGASWIYLQKSKNLGNPRFRAVFFTDILRGWICGEEGVLWQTTDGGTNWKIVKDLPNIDFYDIFASDTYGTSRDNREGVLVGSGGRIVKFGF
jgi:photosystem II stability/assembly factor-like uncharacterized protein